MTMTETFTRGDLSKSLLSGICEVHYLNSDGELVDIACTLRKFHINLTKEKDWVDKVYDQNDLVVWSLRDEGWVVIPVNNIQSYEQLTGVPKV